MSAIAFIVLAITFLSAPSSGSAGALNSAVTNEVPAKIIEIFDGVYVNLPRSSGNATSRRKLFSVEVDLDKDKDVVEGRSKRKKLMQRILPLFIMPFLIQSTIIPMFLSMLKFMLMKSLMVGKLALILIIINAFRNNNSFKGRQEAEMANVHYGYHGNGMEEYGAYIN